ncbi:ankyrin repeat domain-containing protein [Aquimarina longa]|uniref:ankyrin repeat domain-containing protein n=1 Tax=Aquimarina longa TaxID=1080221 RepID=UPI00078394FA|nr:ankyrin repeat domain-containing protein [Aquimarina longa]
MRKAILATLMVICTVYVSVGAETSTITTSHDYDLMIYKTSPFCMAIVKGDLETVKKLIELGSDVNEKSEGMTPLMYAARFNRTEIIKVLVKKGARIKTKDSKGYTAMKFAKLSNAKEAITLLKELS